MGDLRRCSPRRAAARCAVSYSEGNCTGCEAFGEATPPAALVSDGGSGGRSSRPTPARTSVKYNVLRRHRDQYHFRHQRGGNQNFPSYGLNMFSNPAAVYSEFRPCVLGFDTSCGGAGNLRGLPTWNLDLSIVKDVSLP